MKTLYMMTNKITREVKLFDSQVAIRLFRKDNPEWIPTGNFEK